MSTVRTVPIESLTMEELKSAFKIAEAYAACLHAENQKLTERLRQTEEDRDEYYDEARGFAKWLKELGEDPDGEEMRAAYVAWAKATENKSQGSPIFNDHISELGFKAKQRRFENKVSRGYFIPPQYYSTTYVATMENLEIKIKPLVELQPETIPKMPVWENCFAVDDFIYNTFESTANPLPANTVDPITEGVDSGKHFITSANIYAAYVAWTKATGKETWSHRKFCYHISSLGFETKQRRFENKLSRGYFIPSQYYSTTKNIVSQSETAVAATSGC